MVNALTIAVKAGATACLGTGGLAYAAMAPASQLFGKTLIAPRLTGQTADGGDGRNRLGELALTFDDGPNRAWTPMLLDALAAAQVKATFFLVGRFAADQPTLTRRIADEGHQIGNHTWSHPNLAITPAAKIRQEIARASATLEDLTGQKLRFLRPPFGGKRPAALRIARELGLEPVLWNAMTADWSATRADEIVAPLTRAIDRVLHSGYGANIVLHDGGHLGPETNRSASVLAAAQIARKYAPTHRFVRLDDWF